MTCCGCGPPSGGTATQVDRHFMTSVAVADRAEATVAHIDRHFMTCGGCGPPSGGTAAQVDRHFMTSVAVAVRAEATVAHIDRHFMTSVAVAVRAAHVDRHFMTSFMGPSGDAGQPVRRRFTGIPRWNRVRTSSDEVSDSEDEEEMAQLLKSEKKKLKKKEKKTIRSKTEAPAPSKDTPKDTDEIADLIDQLAGLDIKDPSYPAMYFRIIVHAPNMVPFLAKPSTHSSEISTCSNTTGPILAPTTTMTAPQAVNSSTCYFCGKTGHGVRRCQLCEDMISAGTILWNDQGRITWPDGSNIARGFNKNILTAVNRELASRTKSTNLICATTTTQEVGSISKDDYIVHNGQVFVAVRGKENRAPRKEAHEDPKRRMIFNGILLPPMPAAPKPMDPIAQEPRIVLPPPLATYEQPPAPFDPFDDDEIMEDVSSDASTDSTTFPVKKTPKRPK